MQLIEGKAIAESLRDEIANQVRKMIDDNLDAPHLAAILVGEDPASQTYINNKEKACREAGIVSTVYRFPSSITEKELIEVVGFINVDPEIDGLIVQVPLPKHINPDNIIKAVLPSKDVDGFHPLNIGRMTANLPAYIPATPYGILKLLEKSGIETEGKHCVVVGRSNIVGTPVSVLLSRNSNPGNCTVTLCHSKTVNLIDYTSKADILIAAVGKPHIITADMVKDGAVVIDVGIHRVPDAKTESGFRLVGDVKFDEVAPKCSHITPVPGGVGPMTIVGLLLNTLKAARKEIYS